MHNHYAFPNATIEQSKTGIKAVVMVSQYYRKDDKRACIVTALVVAQLINLKNQLKQFTTRCYYRAFVKSFSRCWDRYDTESLLYSFSYSSVFNYRYNAHNNITRYEHKLLILYRNKLLKALRNKLIPVQYICLMEHKCFEYTYSEQDKYCIYVLTIVRNKIKVA